MGMKTTTALSTAHKQDMRSLILGTITYEYAEPGQESCMRPEQQMLNMNMFQIQRFYII